MYKINKVSLSPVVDFAAEELKKYLRMMMPQCGDIPIGYDKDDKLSFRLGLMQDFAIDVSEAADASLDDIIHIETNDKGGLISGSNPRSVLLAVYKFLKLNGCRWLYPGLDGEYIPLISDLKSVSYHKMADHRYRGQCIEGSEMQTNFLETIDFSVKNGMNVYMFQFDNPHYYHNTWYSHGGNRFKEDEHISKETSLQWKRMCEAEMDKRGIQFHDVGHGWTSDSFGYDSTGAWSDRFKAEIIPGGENKDYIAQINGERKFFMNVSLNTNFCMSNPKARKIVVNYIADYAEKHTNVDFLHVWLADSYNNHCECEECKKKSTSDWYVILLNELDKEYGKRNIKSKIVFIAYHDLLWSPETEKINNPERFALLFAPITRSYSESYAVKPDTTSYIPYPRNKITHKGLSQNLHYLNKWKEIYKGDCISFDYHFHWVHYCDPGYMSISRCIYDDIKNLKKCGLDGMIACQTQRCFFPTGLPQYIYSEMLFDSSLSLEEIAKDYFSHAFGDKWELPLKYLKNVSELFDFSYMISTSPFAHYKKSFESKIIADNLKKIYSLLDEFSKIIEENNCHIARSHYVSWQLLKEHISFCRGYADAVINRALGNYSEAKKQFISLCDEMASKEDALQRYFDVGLFSYITGILFRDDLTTIT